MMRRRPRPTLFVEDVLASRAVERTGDAHYATDLSLSNWPFGRIDDESGSSWSRSAIFDQKSGTIHQAITTPFKG
jgi:hypothetical protein